MAKIPFSGQSAIPLDRLAAQRDYSLGLGLPRLGEAGPVAPRLAVVGGSPALLDHLDELRDWDGEIWAINDCWHWLKTEGINATYYTIDPLGNRLWTVDGVKRAVIAERLNPLIVDRLIAQGADIEMMILGSGPDEILHDTSAAGTATYAALRRGHTSVTYFGVTGSFTGNSHVYRNSPGGRLWVTCGGEAYLTSPQLIMQVEFMAPLIRKFPSFIEVRGDGFLPAMIEHGDYDVTHVSRDIHEALQETAA